MVQYKLKYFDGRGMAEIIRQVFTVAGQEFEDVRYSFEEWPKHKEEMPFGQMPVLEVDGKPLSQSFAILRYLGRKFGLSGKNAWEEATVDSVGDQIKDYVLEIRPFIRASAGLAPGDPEVLKKDVYIPARDKFFALMEKMLKNNKSGYLVGDSLTWVDVYLAEMAAMDSQAVESCNKFPEVTAHAEKIHSIPSLKKYLQARPNTKF